MKYRARRRMIFGGGTGPTPPAISDGTDPIIWLRSTEQIYQDSGFTTVAAAADDPVGGWKDLSGNSNHVTQATAGKRPLLKLSQVNGHPGVRFDSTDDFLQSAGFTWAQPAHIWVVCRQYGDNSAGARTLLHGVGTSASLFCNAIAGRYSANAGGGAINNDDLAVPSYVYCICEVRHNGVNGRLRINAGTAITGNTGTNGKGGLTLGANQDGTAPGKLDVAEVIGYSVSLSEADQEIVRNFLNTRYAIF